MTADTRIGIYTGADVADLLEVTKNDDAAVDDARSTVTFDATSGTVYRIQLGDTPPAESQRFVARWYLAEEPWQGTTCNTSGNVLTNPSLETTDSNWDVTPESGSEAQNLVRRLGDASHGWYCAEVTTSGVDGAGFLYTDTASRVYDGNTTISVWVKFAAGLPRQMVIRPKISGVRMIPIDAGGDVTFNPSGEWQQFIFQYQPFGETPGLLTIAIQVAGGGGAAVLRADCLQAIPIAAPPPPPDFLRGGANPPGLEAKIEFNGLVMGDNSASEPFYVTEIQGLNDADVRDSRALNPGRHGETAFDPSLYGGRTIVISGTMVASNLRRLREMRRQMRTAFIDLEEHELILHGFDYAQDVSIRCRKSSASVSPERQESDYWKRDFQLTLRATDPRFQGYGPFNLFTSTGDFQSLKGRVYQRTYPLSYPQYIDASGTPFDFTPGSGPFPANKGNFEAWPVFTLRGPMTNPVILNQTTGHAMTLQVELVGGDTLTLDCASRSITDFDGNLVLGLLSADSEWVVLRPGDNIVLLGGTALPPGALMSMRWKDAWL